MIRPLRSLTHRLALLGPLAVGIALVPSASLPAAETGNPAYADPAKTDDDFPFQGEYSGEVPVGGAPMKLGV